MMEEAFKVFLLKYDKQIEAELMRKGIPKTAQSQLLKMPAKPKKITGVKDKEISIMKKAILVKVLFFIIFNQGQINMTISSWILF